MKIRVSVLSGLAIFLFILSGTCIAANNVKIGTISLQEILATSKAGQEAQKIFQKEMLKHQPAIEKQQAELENLEAEILKKSSAWAPDVKRTKEREYQTKARDLKLKSDDYKYEMGQLEKKIMEPILKDIHNIINEVGKKEGFTLIIENTMKGLRSPSGLLYSDDAIDISDIVRTEMDKRYKKK